MIGHLVVRKIWFGVIDQVLEVLAMSSYVQEEHQWLLLLFGVIFPQDAHLILVQQQVAISS